MSIEVMTLVWKSFPGAGTELLTMLACADWCNDSGGSLFPSIATVAARTRVSESQARRNMHRLIEGGWLEVVGNEKGGLAKGGLIGATRQYRLNVDRLRTHARTVEKPCAGARLRSGERVAPAREKGGTGDTRTVINRHWRDHTSRARELAAVLCDSGFSVSMGDARVAEAVAAGVTAPHLAEVLDVYGKAARFNSPEYCLRIAIDQAQRARGLETAT